VNDYELVTILNGEIKDEDVEETVGRIGQFITNRGGEVQNVDQWGRRRLAYPIGRQLEGTYVVTHLRMPPANAAELEANLRISEDVIRHLLVRYSPAEQAAAIAAAQRRLRPRPITDEDSEEGGRQAAPAADAEPAASTTTEPVAEAAAEAAVEAESPAATETPVATEESSTEAAEETAVHESNEAGASENT
jgi:small subunit ribosomal protein S6